MEPLLTLQIEVISFENLLTWFHNRQYFFKLAIKYFFSIFATGRFLANVLLTAVIETGVVCSLVSLLFMFNELWHVMNQTTCFHAGDPRFDTRSSIHGSSFQLNKPTHPLTSTVNQPQCSQGFIYRKYTNNTLYTIMMITKWRYTHHTISHPTHKSTELFHCNIIKVASPDIPNQPPRSMGIDIKTLCSE